MTNIKTAISINQSLFEEVEALAAELAVSRSGLFTRAARDFIDYHKNQKLLASINAAYRNVPDAIEPKMKTNLKSRHRRIVKDSW